MNSLRSVINTIILTSEENYVWHSMQEIIPHIERCWLNTKSEFHNPISYNVDKHSLKEILKSMVEAQNLVIACITYKIFHIACLVRSTINTDIRIIIHLHNQASLGLWPLKKLKLLDLLNSNDIFISSCKRDTSIFNLLINNLACFTIPFGFDSRFISTLEKAKTLPLKKKLVFVGRISRQKNLNYIIEAINLLKKDQIEIHFDIYGAEDNLGSPNMGFEDTDCLNDLKKLISDYNLELLVHFKGYQSRQLIYEKFLDSRIIFISVSAHSDENFGMSAFASLVRGDKAILSNWGGHADFAEYFPQQVDLIDVIPCDGNGLKIDIDNLKNTINSILTSNANPVYTNKLTHYSEDKISTNFLNLAISEQSTCKTPIEFKELYFKVLVCRIKYQAFTMKIFENYNDPNALQFFKEYGLKT